MTPGMQTPHTTCPSCREEIYLEELVEGRCPLCGWSLDDDGCQDEFPGDATPVAWSYCVLRQFSALGVSPADLLDLALRLEEGAEGDLDDDCSYTFCVRMTLGDRIRPKKCDRCGRLFIAGGEKRVTGSFRSPDISTSYRCPGCTGDQ